MLHIKQTFIANCENTPSRLLGISVLYCWQQQQKNSKEMPVFVSENNEYKTRLNIQRNAFTFLSWEGTNTKGCK